jgi:hypothetical protein
MQPHTVLILTGRAAKKLRALWFSPPSYDSTLPRIFISELKALAPPCAAAPCTLIAGRRATWRSPALLHPINTLLGERRATSLVHSFLLAPTGFSMHALPRWGSCRRQRRR